MRSRTMRYLTTRMNKAVIAVMILLLATTIASAQTLVLRSQRTTTTLPDGQTVPMWGYSCGPASASTIKCAAMNGSAAWSPVMITVPSGSNLTIALSNSLPVPSSVTIVGQLGGGLGTTATSAASPVHPPQGASWPIAGDNSGPVFNPPPQPPRVQSFVAEAAAATTTGNVTTPGAHSYTWNSLRP